MWTRCLHKPGVPWAIVFHFRRSTKQQSSSFNAYIGSYLTLLEFLVLCVLLLQQATQVDASFAYGHTLCGHEYVASDDLEKALSCFRSALRIDPRHYNAWFGLGAWTINTVVVVVGGGWQAEADNLF